MCVCVRACVLVRECVFVLVCVCVYSVEEQMSNVMWSGMKGGGWEAASLQGRLTGVTLAADWLIPSLSEPSHDA